MNTPTPAPTIEEFKAETIKRLEPMVESLRKKRNLKPVTEYMETEEAKRTLKNAYEDNVARYNSGEISREIFMGDAVSSVAYCLYMMYE